MINEFQGKCLISDETIATLSSLNPDIKDLIQRKLKFKTNLKYPPSLQTFALTLHFYSAKAYDYVRQFFDTCLPHPDTRPSRDGGIEVLMDNQALLIKHSKL